MVNQLKSEAMKSIIYIGLLLLTLTSCQEDKGNYTYRNINEISVTGIAATKTVTQFSILGMSPVINQTMPVSADDLEYLWYVDRGNGKIDTLSQELNIQTPVNLYPDTYEAYFERICESGLLGTIGRSGTGCIRESEPGFTSGEEPLSGMLYV